MFNLAQDRLRLFFAYQAATNPRVRFLVYSRGRRGPTRRRGRLDARSRGAVSQLEGRLFTMLVPGSAKATFRDPATAKTLVARVNEILEPGGQSLEP